MPTRPAIDAFRSSCTEPARIADEVHTVPAVLRRRSPEEVSDHHLATIRASMLALGLSRHWIDSILDEAARMVEVGK